MQKITTKQLVFSAMALALATVISVTMKFSFLANGGSITLFSMLVVCLIGYWYGVKVGLLAAIAYGVLQFVVGPYVVHPLQVILDYPLAFGALGLSGLFADKKHGLIKGFLCGAMGRLVMHCISGVIFYTSYVGDVIGNINAIWAGIVYNMSYIIPETVATLLLLALPPVQKLMAQLKKTALQ